MRWPFVVWLWVWVVPLLCPVAVLAAESANSAVLSRYEAARRRALSSRKPLLVYVGRHDCQACRVMEQQVVNNLDPKTYEFATIWHDEDRALALRVIWGNAKAGNNLRAMAQTTVPQLLLWIPAKDGKWFRFRLVAPPSLEN